MLHRKLENFAEPVCGVNLQLIPRKNQLQRSNKLALTEMRMIKRLVQLQTALNMQSQNLPLQSVLSILALKIRFQPPF